MNIDACSHWTERETDGAIAQLGERLNGIQEVRGSIPLGSTNSTHVEIVRENPCIFVFEQARSVPAFERFPD